jgi:hypothetical protein
MSQFAELMERLDTWLSASEKHKNPWRRFAFGTAMASIIVLFLGGFFGGLAGLIWLINTLLSNEMYWTLGFCIVIGIILIGGLVQVGRDGD